MKRVAESNNNSKSFWICSTAANVSTLYTR